MDAIIEELNPKVIGKQLGMNLYSPKGNLLLRRGAEITSARYSHLRETGYKSVYLLQNGGSEFDSNGLVISENLQAKAPSMLRVIFKRLLNGKKRSDILKGKQELNRLVENLLKEISIRSHTRFRVLDLKRQSDYFYQHALEVALYSIIIGHSMNYHQLKLMDLALGAILHDFGKLFLDEAILNKPVPLTDTEFQQYKEHTTKGFQYLGRQCQFDGLITIVALQHHERYDGSGYPRGISGSEMHEYTRIVSLANFFDTYTSDRPHRRLHSIEEAILKIKSEQGKAFDPDIVRHFLRFFE